MLAVLDTRSIRKCSGERNVSEARWGISRTLYANPKSHVTT
ncbi:hypothetical protein CNR35_00072 [Pseudomonas phage inbricus]|uniref:Uncharacterized protein n=1 Tax=Pseudomonas phage inbricus TaxID=2048976 RepID=A0A2H4P7M8_9CAUD|nr:hypothetical protein KMC58_gp72 [Pseudomonas phage inbricus]ATW58168.1 hypothetical protein CNR35_00072 [Pseudomonas phage inbricus]